MGQCGRVVTHCNVTYRAHIRANHISFLIKVLEIMAEELGWSEAEQLKQKEEALSFLRTQMGKDLNKASRDSIPVSLTKAEIAEYVNRFNSLDGDKKGFVSINDIRKSLQVQYGIKMLFMPTRDARKAEFKISTQVISQFKCHRSGVVQQEIIGPECTRSTE